MKRFKTLIILFILLILTLPSYGGMEEFAKNYLQELESRNGSVFFTMCKAKINDDYTSTLVFEVGNKKGFLIEDKNKVVVNLATVIIGDKGIVIEETHGGVYTYERVKKLVDEMIKYRFTLLSPMKAEILKSNKPLDRCENVP